MPETKTVYKSKEKQVKAIVFEQGKFMEYDMGTIDNLKTDVKHNGKKLTPDKKLIFTERGWFGRIKQQYLLYDFTSNAPKTDDKETSVGMIDKFANRLSLLTWGAHRKSREEAVISMRGMKEEKPGLRIESLEKVEITPPEGESKRRKRLGII